MLKMKIEAMKKILVTVFVVLFSSSMGWAQHCFGVSIDGAVTWQFDNLSFTKNGMGVGPSIGAVYQFQNNKLLLQTGLSVSESFMRVKVDSMHIAEPSVDSEGFDFTYRGDLYDRMDKTMITELSIPLMLGAKSDHLYILGGVRLVVPVFALSKQEALLTTKGDYGDRYYEWLEDMPQHGFFTAQPVQTQDKLAMPINMNLCAELGGSWNMGKPTPKKAAKVFQIGAFVEYSLLKGVKGTENPLIEVDATDIMQVKMNHVYSSLPKHGVVLHGLSVGVRMKVLLAMGKNSNSQHRRDIDGQCGISIMRSSYR